MATFTPEGFLGGIAEKFKDNVVSKSRYTPNDAATQFFGDTPVFENPKVGAWQNPLAKSTYALPSTATKTQLAKAVGKGAVPGAAALVGGQALSHASDYLPTAPGVVTDSAATGLQVGGTASLLGTTAARAGAIGVGITAADLGARALGHITDNRLGSKDGFAAQVKDAFGGSQAPGYDPTAGEPLMNTFDELNLSERQRREIMSNVDMWAKEGKYDEYGNKVLEGGYVNGGAEAVKLGIQAAHEAAAQRDANRHAMAVQKMSYNLLQKVGGRQAERAQNYLARTEELAKGMPPRMADAMLFAARTEAHAAANVSDAYLAQAALNPTVDRLLQQAQQTTDIQTQIGRETEYAESAGTGAFPVE